MAARVLVPERDWEGKQSGIVRQAQGVGGIGGGAMFRVSPIRSCPVRVTGGQVPVNRG